MNNSELLNSVYEEYHGKIQNYIFRKVQNMTVAEDLTSVVFLKITEKIDKYDAAKASVSTWIYTIANNTVIDYYRVNKVWDEIPEDVRDSSEVEEEVLNSEMLEELAFALEQLPERERDLIILHYSKNLTLREVSSRLGMSYANVKIVHSKALSKLKVILGE